MTKITKLVSIITLTSLLSACGGGSDAGSETQKTPLPTWQRGVFEDASIFKNKCENPRTGVDSNGKAYPDTAGSALHEKHWLRSWSNNTYLWYDEIVDQDIADFDDTTTYFHTLKTDATTPSGAKQDRFHYAQDTAEYELLRSGGATASYGMTIKLIQSSPPRLARIAYVEPNSPAANANLSRGAEILRIDGVDVKNGADTNTLNAGLFPEKNGEIHTFVIQEVGAITPRTITLRSTQVTPSPVHNTRVITTNSGKVGYLTFNTFGSATAEVALYDAFTQLAAEDVTDLVLDLRYNGGGYLAISAQLAYMIAGPTLTDGKTFEKTVFNNKHPTTNPITGDSIDPIPFVKQSLGFTVPAGRLLPSLNLNRVYILSASGTCSASESLINGLRGIDMEVILIGDTSCGKPYGFYPTDNCGTTYSTIQFRGENDKGFGDYADGFSPNNASGAVGERIDGCQVDDDFLHTLGNTDEAMLNAALNYRNDGSCPPVAAERAQRTSENHSIEGDLRNDPRLIERELQERIRLDSLRVVQE